MTVTALTDEPRTCQGPALRAPASPSRTHLTTFRPKSRIRGLAARPLAAVVARLGGACAPRGRARGARVSREGRLARAWPAPPPAGGAPGCPRGQPPRGPPATACGGESRRFRQPRAPGALAPRAPPGSSSLPSSLPALCPLLPSMAHRAAVPQSKPWALLPWPSPEISRSTKPRLLAAVSEPGGPQRAGSRVYRGPPPAKPHRAVHPLGLGPWGSLRSHRLARLRPAVGLHTGAPEPEQRPSAQAEGNQGEAHISSGAVRPTKLSAPGTLRFLKTEMWT